MCVPVVSKVQARLTSSAANNNKQHLQRGLQALRKRLQPLCPLPLFPQCCCCGRMVWVYPWGLFGFITLQRPYCPFGPLVLHAVASTWSFLCLSFAITLVAPVAVVQHHQIMSCCAASVCLFLFSPAPLAPHPCSHMSQITTFVIICLNRMSLIEQHEAPAPSGRHDKHGLRQDP